MIEKFSSIRWNYNLDQDVWDSEEYLKTTYKKTYKTYPLVNTGKLVCYSGLATTKLKILFFIYYLL